MPEPGASTGEWWKTAVIYQVYIRSFADGDGDGVGDIQGLRARLPYLAELGVDALWINPWFPSPMHDGGYDVADYRDIEPAFGTLMEAEALIEEAHNLGLKILLDIVPNHTSSDHEWFQAALRGEPDARARYIFRVGRGDNGELPPNDWASNFGGPAWSRVPGADGSTGDWYLHLFAPEQPDLDWTNPEVRDEFEDILRFWFDRDIDGFRIDVAHGLSKAEGLPDAGPRDGSLAGNASHPAWDQDGVHEIYRVWRKVADSYDPPRIFVAEAWVSTSERLAQYLRADELHTAFQFDFLRAPFQADVMREVIDDAMASAAAVSAATSWVLSNHDVVRQVTRYARTQPAGLVDTNWERARWGSEPADIPRGLQRARAAIMLTLSLPGGAYLYQGEELGLAEVEDIPSELRLDPTWKQSGHTNPGRDGCRVPLPWSGDRSPFGFSANEAVVPWLPQPAEWVALTAETQEHDCESTLNLYRRALSLRRKYFAGVHPVTWVDSPAQTLGLRRGDVECWINTGALDVRLPPGQVLLTSGPGTHTGALPVDTAVWVVVS
ncbi:MAG: glycoside hydrolase family 13 protein [Nocardioidaceae bacterium]